MIVIAAALIGALIGAGSARRRGGRPADIAQYAAAHGIAFAVAGLVASIVIERLAG
jgi:hypothetical protein